MGTCVRPECLSPTCQFGGRASRAASFRLTDNQTNHYNTTVIQSKMFREAEMARSLKVGITALALGAAAMIVAPSAFAQAADKKGDEGYGYTFDDDPLNAGGFGPNDATIRVRPRAARTTLIRPRTSFVPEMLKSVENL